jgi:putative lipoprotein (rSAM/lipoprotein system)
MCQLKSINLLKMNRRTFIKKINWVLAGILSVLGFAGCEKIGIDEYGTPHADYTVKGAVFNKATKKPIAGIQVGYSCTTCPIFMYGPPPAYYRPKAHVLTNAKGEFKLTDRFNIGEYQTEAGSPVLAVYAEDIDGEKNGQFQTEYLQVNFKDAKHSGKPIKWYEGEYTVTAYIELTEVEK